MPLLVEVRFEHHAPKDSETGLKELVVANDLDQALSYIDKEHLLDYFAEAEEDNETEDVSSHYPTDEWWEKHPEKKAELAAFGLTVDEWGDVQGPEMAITRWLSATTWKDADDAFYGVTHWDWSNRQEISEADAEVLFRLGLAKDIRTWEPPTDG
jgi:hypothetical protein